MLSLDLTMDLHPTAQNYARAESLGLTVDLHPTAENYTQAVKLDQTVDLYPTAEYHAEAVQLALKCTYASDRGESRAGWCDWTHL